MANLVAVIPAPDTPILGPNGRMADVWWRIIATLIMRTGGVSGGDGQLTLADVLGLEETFAQPGVAGLHERVVELLGASPVASQRVAEVLAATPHPTPRIAEMVFAPNYAGLGAAAYQSVSYFLQAENNLSDVASSSTARTNLGLGSMATQNANTVAVTGGSITGTSVGTNATPAAGIFTTVAGLLPPSSANWAQQGSYFGWNYASGTGETDFINSHGGGAGGFNFYTVASSVSATPSLLASINSAGLLSALAFSNGDTNLMRSSSTLTNGAGVQTATLTNGPTAGNPTKWVPINDNGTTRYIPAW